MDKSILKSVIFAQQESKPALVQQITRERQAVISDYVALPHAVVVTGVRRGGKSTLLEQVRQAYYPKGAYSLTFEDERLLDFNVKDFAVLLETFIELQGELKVCFFDEIQNIEQWEVFIRRIITEGYKCFITGSNASMLSQELGTRLTGRHISIELLPYSFREYLQFQQIEVTEKSIIVPSSKAKIKKLFNNYLLQGGMPEYLQYQNKEILISTYKDIIYRDIINRYNIKDIAAFRRLSLYLFNNYAARITYNALKKVINVSNTTTISNYVYYLENSYLIFVVNQYSFSFKQQQLLPKKVYVIDNGMANNIALQSTPNYGRLLENCVYLELRRHYQEIFYYKTENDLEVDFVILQQGKIQQLIQVCYALESDKTKNREIQALLSAMQETGLTNGLILTDDTNDIIKIDKKTITVQTVYQWLLVNMKNTTNF